jgi:hypothetical protein
MTLAPPKFRPHLPEKYDGMVNPVEFLQIYSTSILAAGGNEAVMANYFPVALTGTARSWLMNLPEGTLHSWSELCRQFTANFESAYAQSGNETDLHAIQQRPGESLRSFVQRFSQVHNTIPHISNAYVVVAFRQGVRDEKMLEKLTTHDIQDVFRLFSLADKCARATEGRAWHSPATQATKGESMPSVGAQDQGSGNDNDNKKKKKKASSNQPLTRAPTAVATVAGGGRGGLRGDKRPRQPSNSDGTSTKCPVHNSMRHTAAECREIQKLVKQFRQKMQQRQDGAPSCQREGKQKVDSQVEKDVEMEFQDAKRALKAFHGHSDSESSDNEHRKMLHIMFRGSWAITSRHVVKTLCQEVAAVAPTLKAAPHCKWMETPIGFDSSNYPKSMAGAGQLPLLVSQTISNIKLYHVLIDRGVAPNLISLATFKKLQIPMGKLQPSRPFSRVGPVSVTPRGCVSLPVTFRMTENFRTESVLFNVAEVSLPFNAILGRPALYQFMAVAHYGYLVLKMPSLNGILKIRGGP